MSTEVLKELEFYEQAQQRAMAKAKMESDKEKIEKYVSRSDELPRMDWLDEKHFAKTPPDVLDPNEVSTKPNLNESPTEPFESSQ